MYFFMIEAATIELNNDVITDEDDQVNNEAWREAAYANQKHAQETENADAQEKTDTQEKKELHSPADIIAELQRITNEVKETSQRQVHLNELKTYNQRAGKDARYSELELNKNVDTKGDNSSKFHYRGAFENGDATLLRKKENGEWDLITSSGKYLSEMLTFAGEDKDESIDEARLQADFKIAIQQLLQEQAAVLHTFNSKGEIIGIQKFRCDEYGRTVSVIFTADKVKEYEIEDDLDDFSLHEDDLDISGSNNAALENSAITLSQIGKKNILSTAKATATKVNGKETAKNIELGAAFKKTLKDSQEINVFSAEMPKNAQTFDASGAAIFFNEDAGEIEGEIEEEGTYLQKANPSPSNAEKINLSGIEIADNLTAEQKIENAEMPANQDAILLFSSSTAQDKQVIKSTEAAINLTGIEIAQNNLQNNSKELPEKNNAATGAKIVTDKLTQELAQGQQTISHSHSYEEIRYKETAQSQIVGAETIPINTNAEQASSIQNESGITLLNSESAAAQKSEQSDLIYNLANIEIAVSTLQTKANTSETKTETAGIENGQQAITIETQNLQPQNENIQPIEKQINNKANKIIVKTKEKTIVPKIIVKAKSATIVENSETPNKTQKIADLEKIIPRKAMNDASEKMRRDFPNLAQALEKSAKKIDISTAEKKLAPDSAKKTEKGKILSIANVIRTAQKELELLKSGSETRKYNLASALTDDEEQLAKNIITNLPLRPAEELVLAA
jgi:hypothetical protein